MTVTVKHSKTNAISDWTQAQLDEQIALGNFAEGTVLADIVLPSDWNNDHTLTGVGTMAEQNANSVAITGGSVNGTTIGATTASTGKFTTLEVVNSGANSGLTLLRNTDSSTNSTRLFFDGSGGTTAIYNSANSILFNTSSTIGVSSGNNQFRVAPTGSAVNYVQVTGGATSANPVISAQGSDSTVNLSFQRKGNGNFQFLGPVILGSNAVNYWQTSGAATTLAPQLQVLGSDTNISMAFQPKGTGAIDLAAGSSGVNISNGGTVTSVTRTNQGSGYTTLPTWTASAPTTAGGVTASGSATSLGGVSATIAGGGTGYTAGNVLTVSGGTFSSASTITVNAVSGGVITSATLTNGGTYTVVPSNPVSVTGGSGTGATFNVSYGIVGLTTSVAGSGYIEQPTVTFSGGGGSGAAAYATVGSGTIVRSLGSTMSFHTPNGETFRASDNNATAVNYWAFSAGTASANPLISVGGSGTNVSQTFNTKGTGVYQFSTGSALQFQIANTASAVNYVQVTGGATLNPPVISSQGSDATIALLFQAKGGQNIRFYSAAGSAEQFRITHTAGTIANYASVTGNVAGSAPSFSVGGSDTNIDLALTPKGTGLVRFGTYTAGALTATGYINIKAADGTTYKVLVST